MVSYFSLLCKKSVESWTVQKTKLLFFALSETWGNSFLALYVFLVLEFSFLRMSQWKEQQTFDSELSSNSGCVICLQNLRQISYIH